MQNNTNGLNEILTLLDNLPEGSGGSGGLTLVSTLEDIDSVVNYRYTCNLSNPLQSNTYYLVHIILSTGEGGTPPYTAAIGFMNFGDMGSFNAAKLYFSFGDGDIIGDGVVYSAKTVGGPASKLMVKLNIDESNTHGISKDNVEINYISIYEL